MSGPDQPDQEFVHPLPGSRLWFFAWWLLLMTATFGPLWLIDRSKLFSIDSSESVLFWKLAALLGYYTLGLTLAGFFAAKGVADLAIAAPPLPRRDHHPLDAGRARVRRKAPCRVVHPARPADHLRHRPRLG